jgi:ribosome-associated translation inhibitor RaiA
MAIDIRGIPIDRDLRTHVATRITGAVADLPTRPIATLVTFFDENGPKGGRAMRCAVTMRLPRRPHVRIENIAETPRLAFDGAFAKLERDLKQARNRDLESKRRPKKYYAASQLMKPEGAGQGVAPGRRTGRRSPSRRRA